jgi:hypothetical protein
MKFLSGSGSGFFLQWLSRLKKNVFIVFLLITGYLLEGTFTSVFKDNKLLRSNKTVEAGFLHFFCLLMEGSGSVQIKIYPDLRGEKT